MKKLITTTYTLIGIVLLSFGQQANLNYSINLNDRSNDEFKVILTVDGLTDENNIYQFAATAPGTYQTMNIGRFVRSFKAYDKKGREIATEKVGDNQWKLSNPKKITKLEYTIAETWDTSLDEMPIYKMCGTSMEDDHVLFNAHCVIGYPQDMQSEALTLNLAYPEKWQIGTALSKNETGAYYAKNFDHAVDSPILLGRLSSAKADFNGTDIELYTYSKTDKITSADLLESMSAMLEAAHKFVVNFPVDRYTFLFHFEDVSAGAWEHSYSSEYIYKEADYINGGGAKITSTAAHEFFHIITPLNIHSEVIEKFNFVTPTPSKHLWLYEATTEWASDMMQVRGGLMTLDDLLSQLSTKLKVDATYFDPNYSLVKLAETSFTAEGQKQYSNIYYRGAVVINLLDLLLLDKSNGKRGLREVVNELSKKYGPDHAFPETKFFDIFTEMTYPEVADFFARYIMDTQPLPLKEYYDKVGVNFISERTIGEGEDAETKKFIFEINPDANEKQLALRKAWTTNL
ncbi:peptidase [Reichenbachiella carrageenanivorans]|uniref:Peptidase n=1 Tax=Reichenbachiella carrageenanivorans TaxID=2979869 RepID=A0ABY6D2R5_9BACT|nr:peptidase [Reichenbachiella carrageenanivorans]UXX80452.1 peptidase [Reichenbachiella carrageenanivorans]